MSRPMSGTTDSKAVEIVLMNHALVAEKNIVAMSPSEIDLVDGAKLSEAAFAAAAGLVFIPGIGEVASAFAAGIGIGAYLSGN